MEHAPNLYRVRDHDAAGARTLHRRHQAGLLVRVIDGTYTDSAVWESLDPVGRHVLVIRAIAPRLRATARLSHQSGALVRGWPLITPPPARVHVRDAATSATEHRAHLVRHAGPMPPAGVVERFAGIVVSRPAEIALDLVGSLDTAAAAVAIDHAVRRNELTIDEFSAGLPAARRRGAARGRLIAAALDARHESVGESFTAIRMLELGLPVPVPQYEFRSSDGITDRVDFWFPDLGVVVEFDGKQKYRDPAMLDGSAPSDVVWREKVREDRLRSVPGVRTVVRPTWRHLVEVDRLRTLFREHRIVC